MVSTNFRAKWYDFNFENSELFWSTLETASKFTRRKIWKKRNNGLCEKIEYWPSVVLRILSPFPFDRERALFCLSAMEINCHPSARMDLSLEEVKNYDEAIIKRLGLKGRNMRERLPWGYITKAINLSIYSRRLPISNINCLVSLDSLS